MIVLDFGPIYTPTGNIAQIDYAQKSADNGSTCIAMKNNNGVLIAVEKPIDSNLYIISEDKRIKKLTRNCVIAATGLLSDMIFFNNLVQRELVGLQGQMAGLPANTAKKVISMHCSEFTRYYGCRPLGVNMLSAVNDSGRYTLYVTDTSSKTREVRGYAVGKGAARAKTELEKINIEELSRKRMIDNAVRILYKCFDPLKDKPFEVEIGILDRSGYREVPREEYIEFVEAYKDLNVDDD